MKRRSLVILAALASALTFGPTVSAADRPSTALVQKGEYNSYVVIMKDQPLVATEGDNLDSAKARLRGQKLRATHNATMRDAGLQTSRVVNQYVTALNGFSARVTYQQALVLANDKDVAMVVPDVLRHPMTDESGDFLGLTSGNGAYKRGVTGKGVVVGVIDTGIWPEHPSFADNGLPAPPIPPLDTSRPACEFGNTAHNPADAAFTCNNKLVGARQMLDTYRALIGADPDEFDSARDDAGHGTHTASTAAGNANVQAKIYGRNVGDGRISGIAPDAHLIAYKALGNLGGFSSDLAAAIDQAVLDGVDVINYSIGGGGGSIAADEVAFMFAAADGVWVASSAGNSGDGAQTVGSPGDVPWLTTVGASTQERMFEGTVKLGNGREYKGVSITPTVGQRRLVDAAALGNELCDPAVAFSASVAGKIVLCKRGVVGRIAKSLAVYNAGGAGMIMYEASDAGSLFSDTHWVPTVHLDNTPGLAIKSYIASAGAYAKAEIKYTNKIAKWKYAPSMTQFSSRGPNNYPDIIKPDVTAPGLQILAGYSPYPDEGEISGDMFAAIAGTSMSSPHVAGLLALLRQVHPDWSQAVAKSALMTTAYQDVLDNDRKHRADPFDMGSGHVNPGSPKERGSAFNPGLAYDAGLLDYAAWTCAIDAGVFTPGTCVSLAGAGYATEEPSDLNYPSIAVAELPGSQTVTRTVTSTETRTVKYRASVRSPKGYDVTVSPSTLTVPAGGQATYTVTIVNETAPIGEWRFGSITWESQSGYGHWSRSKGNGFDDGNHHGDKDGYSVRSPIAVRASDIDVAALVEESGEAGSGSVSVRFGYSGAYSALPHGLVPATVTSDNVLQDTPISNPVFSPSDVATGGANAHTFNLSGVDVFRIALPPDAVDDADADLDVFVFDPSNTLFAQSTAGGTDELVNIENPADGTWTVYVHGWAAPGGDTNYDLYTWAIPDATGGTLSIDSAPASATIGTTGAVNFSWTGATAGQWWFGQITHERSGSLLARTLVNVDNR